MCEEGLWDKQRQVGHLAEEDHEEGLPGGFISLPLASSYCIFTNDLEDNIDCSYCCCRCFVELAGNIHKLLTGGKLRIKKKKETVEI